MKRYFKMMSYTSTSMIYKSSRPNVTARSRNAPIHQIQATLNICRGLQLRAPEEISPREFPRPIKTRKRPGRLSRSTPLPPPSAAPRIAPHSGTRAGGSDDVTTTLTHAHANASYFFLSSSLMRSRCFSILGSGARNNPVCPPSRRSRSPSRSGLTHFHISLKRTSSFCAFLRRVAVRFIHNSNLMLRVVSGLSRKRYWRLHKEVDIRVECCGRSTVRGFEPVSTRSSRCCLSEGLTLFLKLDNA